MPQVTFIAHDGAARTVEIALGTTLMEGAKAHDIDGIDAVCGGNAYCGTCRVHIEPDWRAIAGEATEIELPMLEVSGDDAPGARLSCQIAVTDKLDGLVVRLPASQT